MEGFFLDRFPVTNKVYYEFVSAGGYQQEALWDKAVWPMVPTMLDCSGVPGPRYWNRGCFLPGEEDLPVVGVKLARSGRLCPLARQAFAQRRRMGEGQQFGLSPSRLRLACTGLSLGRRHGTSNTPTCGRRSEPHRTRP